MGKTVHEEPAEWGRVLIAGGTDWASNGKPRKSQVEFGSDLSAPYILRALCHLKITKIISGCTANYAMAIDDQGVVHMFGKLPALAEDSKGVVPIFEAVHVSPRAVGLGPKVKWVDAACGRAHFFLLDSEGGVWGAGMNTIGQLGFPPTGSEVLSLTKVVGPWGKDKIIQVTAGLSSSLFLTDKGHVYAAGSCEHGQLGNGTTGERLVKAGKTAYDAQAPPVRITAGFEDKKIVQIASGNQHSLALDEDGYVYAWGYAGYARLGLGDQKDKLVPTIVPQFVETNPLKRAGKVLCGPSSSIVIDRQDMFWIAGKWKQTGDGSGGAPFTSFKQIVEIAGVKVEKAAFGGCTHFITTPLDIQKHKVQTIAWGQGAVYGELGYGSDRGKSSTKPIEVLPLQGIDVIDLAAGQFISLFLARPNAALGEVDRFPLQVDSSPVCLVCHTDKEPEEEAMECERCDAPYHPKCLSLPLDSLPDDAWFCPACEADSKRTFDDVPLFVAAPGDHDPSPSTPGAYSNTAKRPANSQVGNSAKKPRSN